MAKDKDLFNLGGKDSKGSTNNIDDFGFGEDEDFLKDFDELDEGKREVDFKKIAKKEFGKALTDTSPERIKKAIKNAMPSQFRVEYEDLEGFTSNVSAAIDKNLGGVKKDVAALAANIAKLAPEGKFKSWLESKFKKQDEAIRKAGISRDAAIQQEISNIFAASESSRLEQDAINNALADKRSEREEALQTLIAKDIRALRNYTFEQGVNYQKKSLELKFKHLAIAQDHYELAKATNVEMLRQLNSIAKNTSLPDLLKQRQIEMIGGDLKAKFRSNLINRTLGEKSFIGRLQQSVIDKVTAYGDIIKDRITSAKDHTDDMISAREDMRDMMEMAGGEKAFKAQMAGKGAAGMVDFILSKTLLRKIMEKSSKTKRGKRFVSGIRNLMMDPSQPVRDLANRMLSSENGFVNYAGEFVSEIGDTLNVRRRQPLANLRREALDSSTTFDFRTKVNVNKVIPGYLRMILAETYANRIKLDPSKSSKSLEVHFDYSTEDFVTQTLAQANIIKRFKEETKTGTSFARSRMEYLLGKGLDGKSLGITEKDKRDLANAIMLASQTSSKNGIAILQDKEFAKVLPSHLKKKLGNIQKALLKSSQDNDYFHNDFVDGVNNIRRSVPSFNNYIEQLFKSNDISLLKNLGLVTYDRFTDEYRPDPNGIRRLMYKQFGLELGTVDPSKSKEAQFIDRVARKTALGVKIGKKKAKKAGQALSNTFNTYKNNPNAMFQDMRETGESLGNYGKGIYNKGKDYLQTPKLNPTQVEALKRLADDGVTRAENILEEAGVDYNPTEAKIRKAEKEAKIEEARVAMERAKDVASAVEAIEKAKVTNDVNVLNQTVDSIQGLGQEVASNQQVQKAVTGARKYINESIKTGNDAMNIIKKEKDPERALQKFANMKETIGKFLPSSSSSNLLIKGMSMYVGTLWKLEKWLWKNVYGKVGKGILKGMGFAGKMGLKGLGYGLQTAYQFPRIFPKDYFSTVAAAPFRAAGGIARGIGGLFGLGKGRKRTTVNERGEVVEVDDGWVDTRQNKPKYVNGVLVGSEKKDKEKKPNAILSFLKSWGSKLLMLLGPLGAFFSKFSLGGLAGFIGKAFTSAMSSVVPGVMKLFSNGFNLLKSTLGLGASGLAAGAKAVGSTIAAAGAKAGNFFSGLVGGAKNLVKTASGAVVKGMASVAEVTKRFIMDGFGKCKQLYSFVTEDLYKKVVTGAKGAFDGAKKQIGKVVKSNKIAAKLVGKLSSKMGGLLIPGIGLGLLAWDIGNIVYYMVKENKDLGSAICLQFMGFDPWDETTEVKVGDDILSPAEQEELAQDQASKEVVSSGPTTKIADKPKEQPKPKVTKTGDVQVEAKKVKSITDNEKKANKEKYLKLLEAYGKDMDLTSEEISILKSYAEMKSNFDPNFQDMKRFDKGLGSNVGAFSTSYELLGKAADMLGKERDASDPEIQTFAAILDYKRKKAQMLEMSKGNKLTVEDLNTLLGIDSTRSRQIYNERIREIEQEELKKKQDFNYKESLRVENLNNETLKKVQQSIIDGNTNAGNAMSTQASLTSSTNQAIGDTNTLLAQILVTLQEQNKANKEATEGNKNSTVQYSRSSDTGVPLR